MQLVISLATRGRPQQVVETINRSLPNLVMDNTIFVVQTDDDDPASTEAVLRGVKDPRVRVNSKPREDTIAAKWNRALEIPADVYMTAADDDPYITPAYDAKILEAAKRIPDGLGMVYGHMANASFTGVSAQPRQITEALGYIFPEYFPYWFVDHWNDDLVRIMGRISFADVATDQSKAGKTQEMREPGWWATWYDAAYLMRRKIAHDIIKSDAFESPQWQKDMLLAHHPMIEYRSRWVNTNVRAQAQQYDQWSGLSKHDPRYLRVKQRAIEMLPHLLDDYGMHPHEAAAYRNYLTPPTNVVGLKQAFA